MDWDKILQKAIDHLEHAWRLGILDCLLEYDRQHLQEHHGPKKEDAWWLGECGLKPKEAKPEVCECSHPCHSMTNYGSELDGNWSYCARCGKPLKGGG